jgi:hypothetical protein
MLLGQLYLLLLLLLQAKLSWASCLLAMQARLETR